MSETYSICHAMINFLLSYWQELSSFVFKVENFEFSPDPQRGLQNCIDKRIGKWQDKSKKTSDSLRGDDLVSTKLKT